ncbi:hypothetical protein LBMAG27_22110 [Bacteroidota bacterium]|nr:hypothetical protein LBMAG27_22110 [Bacteroidota bacterium]
MKKALIFSFIHLIAFSLSAQKKYFNFQTITKDSNFSFPIFQSSSDSIVENKINVLLQLYELQLLYEHNETNLFKILQITSDSVIQGNTSLFFNVIENSDKILSVSFSKEWCSASCNYLTEYYNFNSGNGDLISFYDFIQRDKINSAIAAVTEKRKFNFLNQLPNLKSEQTIDTASVLSELINSNLHYFYIKNDSVFISDDECLSKFEKIYYDLNMITGFSAEELKPYLNDYGKTVYSNSKKTIAKFHGNNFPQLYFRIKQ